MHNNNNNKQRCRLNFQIRTNHLKCLNLMHIIHLFFTCFVWNIYFFSYFIIVICYCCCCGYEVFYICVQQSTREREREKGWKKEKNKKNIKQLSDLMYGVEVVEYLLPMNQTIIMISTTHTHIHKTHSPTTKELWCFLNIKYPSRNWYKTMAIVFPFPSNWYKLREEIGSASRPTPTNKHVYRTRGEDLLPIRDMGNFADFDDVRLLFLWYC